MDKGGPLRCNGVIGGAVIRVQCLGYGATWRGLFNIENGGAGW